MITPPSTIAVVTQHLPTNLSTAFVEKDSVNAPAQVARPRALEQGRDRGRVLSVFSTGSGRYQVWAERGPRVTAGRLSVARVRAIDRLNRITGSNPTTTMASAADDESARRSSDASS